MTAKSTSSQRFEARRYLAPRYWPIWLLLGICGLVAQLPLRAQLWVGRRLGDLLHALHAKRRRVAQVNIRLCFPEKDAAAQARLVREAFQSFGMSLFEMASIWFRKPEELVPHTDIRGLEHVEKARAEGRGIILLQAHFTTLEMGGGMLALRTPYDANYDPPKNPMFADWLVMHRKRYVNRMMDNHSIRTMVRYLREGSSVWYSPDQHVAESDGGVPTTFFGQDVMTSSGTARMARISGAVVIPYVPYRSQGDHLYRIDISPPLEHFPSDDVIVDTQRINDLFEQHIRAHPGQYFWLHKRFKRLHPDQPDPYA